jgi:hypothetical protein
MFLASDTKKHRELKIRKFLPADPGVALLVAAVNFEWTICRAVLFLSKRPNSELRSLMAKYFSLDSYKELWNLEVVAGRNFSPLAIVVRNWSAVRKAFEARNKLVHGRDRYTRNMATPHVNVLLLGTNYIDEYCESLGYPLCRRLPVRKQSKAFKP